MGMLSKFLTAKHLPKWFFGCEIWAAADTVTTLTAPLSLYSSPHMHLIFQFLTTVLNLPANVFKAPIYHLLGIQPFAEYCLRRWHTFYILLSTHHASLWDASLTLGTLHPTHLLTPHLQLH